MTQKPDTQPAAAHRKQAERLFTTLMNITADERTTHDEKNGHIVAVIAAVLFKTDATARSEALLKASEMVGDYAVMHGWDYGADVAEELARMAALESDTKPPC